MNQDGSSPPEEIDPDRVLETMRGAIERNDYRLVDRCAYLLDGWLTAGGVLPQSWERACHRLHVTVAREWGKAHHG